MNKVSYDASDMLERCDAPEISFIIDAINLLVLEHINDELLVDIKCKPGQQQHLEQLPFNVDMDFEMVWAQPECVRYRFTR